MRLFKFHKKGVSPLIATVLLIAFAVSLGAVVMNWGRGYVESTTEAVEIQSAGKISCSMDTSLGIVQVGNRQKLCIDRGVSSGDNYTINFTLINTGAIDLEGIQVTEIWADKFVDSYNVEAAIPITRSKLFFNATELSEESTGDPDVDLADLEQIEIAPIILVKGVKTVCLEHAIKRSPSEIGDC